MAFPSLKVVFLTATFSFADNHGNSTGFISAFC